MIEQLSIYMENRRGATRRVLQLLARENINVLGLVTNDSAEFGTLRLILSDVGLAQRILQKEGYLCRTVPVMGVELPDEPGALEELLGCIDDMNINIDYLYVGYLRESGVPVIMLRCEELEIVFSALKRKGYRIH